MRLSRVHIINFRCLTELQLELDDVTVFVGANSTGKSTVLHSLRWLFDGGPLDPEDVAGYQDGATVSVGATFVGFNDADRDALGSYLIGDEATFWRTWSAAEGEKLTGRGRAFPPFEEVRSVAQAMPKRKAYSDLRTARPELGLPAASNQQAVEDAMRAWCAHPDESAGVARSATHLFGFTGGSRLTGRVPISRSSRQSAIPRLRRETLAARSFDSSSIGQWGTRRRFKRA